MKKHILYLLTPILLFGCKKTESELVENNKEKLTFKENKNIPNLLKGNT